ncbi:2-aminoethylphosphonate--pyruvate transaminase [Peptoniphilus harei]|uniref:2-aminoethylphosphonate--pyruvate transaminase n=1 Tax=Peptoniphilus harei TaxID=54005 RepID=A0A2X1XV20_9FIRM|nr:2-aminoethylphosphonate--pyruvate transaminase [Peptoniphilus harei]QQT91496.1 2-aminoethylphosphonate--pyruvate transaminase [Peptoniphilus harei]SPY46449.1 2-aminoethylphosphonate--pyruvate transaminase [Peptoniphilus harei]
MKTYKLLTPGPLTTTETVKKEMMVDHCTWDDDYKKITQEIRNELLRLAHADKSNYTVVLMQGSGTFGVESVLSSVVGEEDKLLIAANGAYGNRMEEIAKLNKIPYVIYKEDYDKIPSAEKIEKILKDDSKITHVSMIHSETTSGILNDIEAVAKVVKEAGKVFIVDAMSSFAGVDIDVEDLRIDFLVSSANKCIQGVPGFSFIICKRDELEKSKEKARTLSLNLYEQWKTMEIDGKWRFTSPTHVVLAFYKALKELQEEGGIPERAKRYRENNKLLIEKMRELGIETYIDSKHQGPIITTFFYPKDSNFNFQDMYDFIKERGYAIYPGKVTEADTFRIGNIGEIYREDILKVVSIFKEFLESNRSK